MHQSQHHRQVRCRLSAESGKAGASEAELSLAALGLELSLAASVLELALASALELALAPASWGPVSTRHKGTKCCRATLCTRPPSSRPRSTAHWRQTGSHSKCHNQQAAPELVRVVSERAKVPELARALRESEPASALELAPVEPEKGLGYHMDTKCCLPMACTRPPSSRL